MTDFSNNALGKLPPLKDKPALHVADILLPPVPAAPTSADHFARVPSWELGGNDRFGTCGPTSVANLRRLITFALTGILGSPSLEDIYDLYRRSGNPGFDPNAPGGGEDNGVVMQTMLEALLSGGIGGIKPIAFAKIAPGDTETLERAIAIFGGVLLGLTLDVAQQTQPVWDYKRGPVWGGHAVMAGKYTDATHADVITWATDVSMTKSFITHQTDEVWIVVWPEHLGSVAFLQGVDQAAFATAYQELTGRPLPLPVMPPPIPSPAPPVPAPDVTDVDAQLAAALTRVISHKSTPHYLKDAATAWLAEQQRA